MNVLFPLSRINSTVRGVKITQCKESCVIQQFHTSHCHIRILTYIYKAPVVYKLQQNKTYYAEKNKITVMLRAIKQHIIHWIYEPVQFPYEAQTIVHAQMTITRQHFLIRALYKNGYYFLMFRLPFVNYRIPTTLQNSFSLTFPDKMNNFPWLISLFTTPVKQY